MLSYKVGMVLRWIGGLIWLIHSLHTNAETSPNLLTSSPNTEQKVDFLEVQIIFHGNIVPNGWCDTVRATASPICESDDWHLANDQFSENFIINSAHGREISGKLRVLLGEIAGHRCVTTGITGRQAAIELPRFPPNQGYLCVSETWKYSIPVRFNRSIKLPAL